MKSQAMKSNLLLLLAAAIWGFAFVAQRVGMDYIGAFTFNGVRFALGSLSLIPLMYIMGRKNKETGNEYPGFKRTIPIGVLAGTILFLGASLQQLGMVYEGGTPEESAFIAGKAAFITGLYIVLVPILGIFLKQYIRLSSWAGVLVAVAGLYFLCVTDRFSISKNDILVLIGAFFWACHIHIIDRFGKRVDVLKLAFIQFVTCSLLSMIAAVATEKIVLGGILDAAVPILYCGIFSVGIAYTLQIVGQKHSKPAPAAIILSMETVFATVGGILLLSENPGVRGYIGCALMLAGMLLSQLQSFKDGKTESLVQHTDQVPIT